MRGQNRWSGSGSYRIVVVGLLRVMLAALVLSAPAVMGDWRSGSHRAEGLLAAGTAEVSHQHYHQAMADFRNAAAAGNGTAIYDVGWLYYHGYGVPQDYAKAMAWWRKAATTGVGLAMYNIGVCYEHGQGVPQDYAEAMAWYRKAAATGHGKAMLNIGVLYYQGEGVPQNYAKAIAW